MTGKRMQFDALVFDFDGTLVDSGESVMRAFRHAVAPWRPNLQVEELEFVRGLGRLEIFEALVGRSAAPQALERLIEVGRDECAGIRLFDGITDVIEDARASGRRLAVWTARDAHTTSEVLRANGVLGHFDLIVGNCTVENNKPHPEGLLKISRSFQIQPERMIHIGDHDHDIVGARGAGCHAIGVQWRDEIKSGKWTGFAEKPDAFFHCPRELRAFLRDTAS